MTLSVAIFGSYLVITGQTTLGTLVAMRSLFTMVFQPSSHLASMAGAVQRALASADRVYAFLDEAPAVREVANIRLKGPCMAR